MRIWLAYHDRFFDKETMERCALFKQLVRTMDKKTEADSCTQPSFRARRSAEILSTNDASYSGISQRKLQTDAQRFGSRLGFIKHPLLENVSDGFMQSGGLILRKRCSRFLIIHGRPDHKQVAKQTPEGIKEVSSVLYNGIIDTK